MRSDRKEAAPRTVVGQGDEVVVPSSPESRDVSAGKPIPAPDAFPGLHSIRGTGQLIHPQVVLKGAKLCSMSVIIRVSHFYTFFELSYTLVTTQAHGL